MIPLTLHLKNFLSYGPETQTIDFSGYPLICLSGKNGHGKSALLDAITWALWGQARKVGDISKADEGLLRLGQSSMLVILDFEFNGQTYRVRREFTKTSSKVVTALDFGMLNITTNAIIPLTEKTIRTTQAKIEAMLNLDAESFINSAFLRQGQSNEFSKKSAKERKEILATILGLTRYETLRKLALERSKQALAEKQALTTLQQALEQELAHEQTIKNQLVAFHEQLKKIQEQEKEYAQAKKELGAQRMNITQKKQHASLLATQQAQCTQEYEQLHHTLANTRTSWRSTHAQLLNLTDRTTLEEQKKQLLHTISHHQNLLQHHLERKEQLLTAKEKLNVIEKEWHDAHTQKMQELKISSERLGVEKKVIATRMGELQHSLQASEQEKLKMQQESALLETQLTQASSHEQKVVACEKQFEKRKGFYQKFIAHGNWLKNELANLEQKKLLVHDDNNPSCPLCEQNLSASRKKFIKNSFAHQEYTVTHQLKRLGNIIKKLKELLVEQHATLTNLKKEQEERARALVRQQDLKNALEKNSAAHQKLLLEYTTMHQSQRDTALQHEKSIQSVAQLEQQTAHLLQNHAPYREAYDACKHLEHTAASVAYKPDAHRSAMEQLNALEARLATYTHLHEQELMQAQRALQITHLCKELKELKKRTADIDSSLQQFLTLPEQERTLEQQEAALENTIQLLSTTKDQLLQEKGKAENQQATLQKHAQEHKKNSATLATLTITAQDYQAIAAAAGKDGIQALLIEDALPEIEHEANLLLAKLTHNQAHIIIESQRDLKKGGAKETLDIKISDPMGIRPYELFSGGEAFRIDFALRVAISKLLARRAGTSLQTLIIDEGFGSQDDEGLSNIMDALYKIQDDFSKIIIVSHLPTMKDQFPVHFYVEKGPNGSRVTVIEQG